MRQRELRRLMAKMGQLTRGQRQLLVVELMAEDRRLASVEVIEACGVARGSCPHCQENRVVRNGQANGLQRYKCRGCGRTFNALTKTPLARLRMKRKWEGQIESLRDGLTIRIAAQRLGVNPKTAFLWRHRFMAAPKTVMAHTVRGIVEADETYFLQSAKGQRGELGRKARRRGGKAAKLGLSVEQIPVLVVRDRTGDTADFILASGSKEPVTSALRPILPIDIILCTDGSGTLAAAAREIGVEHHAVNLSAGVRVDGPWHIQNINSYHSRLKGWMQRFRGVATKYLDSYLGWFRTLDRAPSIGWQLSAFLTLAVTGRSYH